MSRFTMKSAVPIRQIVVGLVSVTLLLTALISCGFMLPQKSSTTTKGATLLLSIAGNTSKTLLPAIDMNIASYDVSGTGPSGQTFSQSTTQTSDEITGLVAGVWNVTVAALNASGQNIGMGSSSVTLSSTDPVSLAITVTPIQGNGTVSLTTTWPASEVQVPSLSASLLPAAGTAIPVSYTMSSGTATATNSTVPSGYYTLSQTLLDNGVLVAGAVEVVRVVAGQTTSGTFDFSNLNMVDPTIGVDITPAMNDPLTVTISGASASLTVGGTMTVSAGVTGYTGNVTYVFYLNGQAKANGTTASPSWTFGSDLAAGNYRLDVTAFSADGLRAGSATSTFTVVSPVPLSASGSAQYPIGVWMQDPLRTRNGQINAVNYKNIGINTFFGLWQWPDESSKYPGYDLPAAQALQANGMKVYAGDNQAAVDWNNANPQFASTFIGYLLGDEPDMNKVSGDATLAAASMPDAWQAAGDALRAADPTRAIYANFGKGFALDPWGGYHVNPGPTEADDFAKYVEPTSVISSDYYAVTDPYEALNQHGIWGYGRAVTNTLKYAGTRPVYGFVEASAPFTQGQVANNLAGTMPPSMIMPAVWEMVVHGASGIIYFCHDFSNGGQVEDGCLADAGMPDAMSAADASVQAYADVLMSASIAGTTATSDGSVPVVTLTKQWGGATYVFAMADGNSSYPSGQAVNSTITVAGAGSGTVTVLTDGRTLTMTNGQFTDHFNAYELHIYRF